MAGQGFQTGNFPEPLGDPDALVTLRLTAGEARRIVRALEQTSQSLCGSPSGSRLAASYMRLASTVRRQSDSG
jgi:hypothetical protein